MMKVYIGADHGGFDLKERLKTYLKRSKYQLIDCGNKKFNKNDDYPVFASRVARKVAKDKNSFGVLICGSGQGVCIAANKIKGIRAALAEHAEDAKLARSDDDCNVICLQGRFTSFDKAKKIVSNFLRTKFKDKTKYKRRVNEIKKIER